MPLHLTRDEKELIRKYVPLTNWWINKSVHSKLDVDDERLEQISNCKHKQVSFSGKKECCGYCGAFYNPGMGESWQALGHPRTIKSGDPIGKGITPS